MMAWQPPRGNVVQMLRSHAFDTHGIESRQFQHDRVNSSKIMINHYLMVI